MTGGTLIAGKNRVPAYRPLWHTWPINDPDAKLSSRSLRTLTNKEKEPKEPKTKKVPKRWPVQTDAAVEIDCGGLRQLFLDDSHRCLKKPTQKPLRLFHRYAQARRRLINDTGKKNREPITPRQCDYYLTEAIHFGNDVHPSVASLRLLDPLRRNRWCLSVGIAGGIRRNTQIRESSGFGPGGRRVANYPRPWMNSMTQSLAGTATGSLTRSTAILTVLKPLTVLRATADR